MELGEFVGLFFFSLVVFMSCVWTFFAWAMGVVNYKEQHSELMGKVASFCWYGLFALHIIALYFLWFQGASGVSVVFTLVCCHCLFYVFFAQNISAR